MKKVVLLGDSICQIGYGTKVPSLLGPGYTVWQPEDNCRFVSYLLRGIFDWSGELEGADIIHWNSGEWDICNLFGDGPFTAENEYVSQCLRVANLLLARAKKVIFATTTPVRQGHPHNDNRLIERYNALIVPQLVSKGVLINDLFAVVEEDIDGNIRADDQIHLTEKGIALCAEATVRAIHHAGQDL